jgi:hypothetical protein
MSPLRRLQLESSPIRPPPPSSAAGHPLQTRPTFADRPQLRRCPQLAAPPCHRSAAAPNLILRPEMVAATPRYPPPLTQYRRHHSVTLWRPCHCVAPLAPPPCSTTVGGLAHSWGQARPHTQGSVLATHRDTRELGTVDWTSIPETLGSKTCTLHQTDKFHK